MSIINTISSVLDTIAFNIADARLANRVFKLFNLYKPQILNGWVDVKRADDLVIIKSDKYHFVTYYNAVDKSLEIHYLVNIFGADQDKLMSYRYTICNPIDVVDKLLETLDRTYVCLNGEDKFYTIARYDEYVECGPTAI